MTSEPIAVSIEQAAERLNLSRGALYPLVMAGRIGSFKVGRRRLIPVAALEAYVAQEMAASDTGTEGSQTDHQQLREIR